MIRKEVVIVLVTFSLTATLFSIIPVGSQGIREYDPWYDMNDDGKIDLKDYYGVGLKYGTEGTPINKTELLMELESRVSNLEEKQNQMKIIRFFEPNETSVLNGPSKVAATFIWHPQNASVNAILSVCLYLEWKGDSDRFMVQVSDLPSIVHSWWYENPTEYRQSPICSIPISWESNFYRYGICSNQPLYIFTVTVGNVQGFGGNIYVRNINLLLTVMDGLSYS